MTQNDSNLSLFDYLGVILKRRRIIIGFTLLIVFLDLVWKFTFDPLYIAETKIWSSEPVQSVAFVKSDYVLRRVGQPLNLGDEKILQSLIIKTEGSMLTLRAFNENGEVAVKIANGIAAALLEKYKEFAAARLAQEKVSLEEQVRFFITKQKEGLYLTNVPLSFSLGPAPFVHVINEATLPLAGSKASELLKSAVFALLIGFFFSLLLAFALEYFESHRGEWEAMKRKWL